jgi:DNA-binding GntR family transcriptional regulator
VTYAFDKAGFDHHRKKRPGEPLRSEWTLYPFVASTGRSTLTAMGGSTDQTLQIVSIADRVYGVLQERILNGELEAGSRLHQENISEELGVSRTPVREALARLAADGLVELLPNRGARVAAVALEDMRTAYEARLGVEPLAARFAAERGDPGDIKAIKAAVTEQRRARGSRATYTAIRRFHLAVVDAAGNPLLSRFAGSLWAGRIALHVFLQQADKAVLDADVEEHEAIVTAIDGGDGELAERLMHRHIAASLEQLVAFRADREPVGAGAESE